jgi:hypothetical protein
MFLDKRNKNIYGLGVGISTVFEVLGHFLFQGGWDHPVWSSPTYHQMSLDTRMKDMYGLGVGISMVFEILGQLRGNRTIPYGHDLYTIRCSLTRETNIYIGDLNSFRDFYQFPVSGGCV